jgi:hypothetical protein
MNIDITKQVRFLNPEPGEEKIIFVVTNYNDVTKRCYIKPVNMNGWAEGLEPEQLVSVYDLINV